MALINKLNEIGDAIREKTGKEDKLTLAQMPDEIRAIETGGSGEAMEPIVLSGDLTYLDYNGIWDSVIQDLGEKGLIETKDITVLDRVFMSPKLEEIPFDLNAKKDTGCSLVNTFYNCPNLKKLPKINNCAPTSLQQLFYGCYNLRGDEINSFLRQLDLETYLPTANKYGAAQMFSYCHSLRKIDEDILSKIISNTMIPSRAIYYYGFYDCFALDEIRGLPVWNESYYDSNMFSGSFNSNYRIKDLTFDLNEDGSPKSARWKNQVIDLTPYVGYIWMEYGILDYSSGITKDKRVTDDATYQSLKDDPDWYTTNADYSRYNHDSAVNTINSLPDTSEYLATAGETNTIKFKGASGSKTDGGAINTLTDEEIAVAIEKGWTVTIS
jgi:hypothetical protein